MCSYQSVDALQFRSELIREDLNKSVSVVRVECLRRFQKPTRNGNSLVNDVNLRLRGGASDMEKSLTKFWRAYTGFDGDVIGIDCFGESAPAAHVAEALGMTVAAVVERACTLARARVPAPRRVQP